MRKADLVKILFALVILAAPAAAIEKLPLGSPDTNPAVHAALPNEHGLDNATVSNLSQFGLDNNLSVGNIVYPPLFTQNAAVVPKEIWIVLLALGAVGILGAFTIPRADAQVISALLGLGLSGYSLVLSAMIGYGATLANAQGWDVTWNGNLYHVIATVIQPVYTVYNPPALWAICLVMVFLAIAGLANGVYNLVMGNLGNGKRNGGDRSG